MTSFGSRVLSTLRHRSPRGARTRSAPGRAESSASAPVLRAGGLLAAALVTALATSPATLAGQYALTAPSGVELAFPTDTLLAMKERSDALHDELERDPDILYFTGYGEDLAPEDADAALPWNAIEVVTDSLAAVLTPGNLREADRAYYSYAVLRMKAVRQDPDVSCEELFDRELAAVGGFVDGWIAARTIFGGPPFAPLDELAFARADGVLEGLIAERGDRQLGGCLAVWRAAHPEAVEAYRAWRRARYLGTGGDEGSGAAHGGR